MMKLCRRTYRVIVSLSDEVAELLGLERGWRAKSDVVEMALRLWYAMSDREREAKLAAVLFTQRQNGSVQ